MYAMALLFKLMLGWSIHASDLLSALIVLVYMFLGGLTSAIYNEVLQFFLIVFGFRRWRYFPWLKAWRVARARRLRLPSGFMHMLDETWRSAHANPMGVDWISRCGAGIRAFVRLLVHGFPGGAAGAGGAGHERGAEARRSSLRCRRCSYRSW